MNWLQPAAVSRENHMINSDDYSQILQVDAFFIHLMDRRDFDRLGEAWAEDSSYDGRANGRGLHEGLAAVRKYLSTSHQPVHIHTNYDFDSLEENGTIARGRTRFFVVFEDNVMTTGFADDTWKKTPLGWRIYRRVSHVLAKPKS